MKLPLPPSPPSQSSLPALLAYGAFGLPLAMVALPVYVHVPQFYAERFGLPLSVIGLTLLLARLLDAFIDPAIGAWIDRSRDERGFGRYIVLALPLLCGGFVALFHPPDLTSTQVLPWFAVAMALVYTGFSMATIAYQAWGAALTQSQELTQLPAERARLTATREACGLAGVVVAAALPGWIGFDGLLWAFIVVIGMAALLLCGCTRRTPRLQEKANVASWLLPFSSSHFRWLFAIFGLNGIAAAIPATLFLFFAQDRLQLAEQAGVFLVLYFVAAACSMPLWVTLARRHGEARAWLFAILLAVAAFVWSFWTRAGSWQAFAVVCTVSGLALGADLALPPALLAAVIRRAGHGGKYEGSYFGAWNWMTKMSLALAAGVALPLLERLGYVPGQATSQGLLALGIAYAVLPCVLKLGAAVLLWRAPLHDF